MYAYGGRQAASLTSILHAFDTKVAQSLSADTRRAKEVQQILEQRLMEGLKATGSLPYRNIYHQGSAYEKLMVGGPEFDLAVIIDIGECHVTNTTDPLKTKLQFLDHRWTRFNNRKQDLLTTFQSSLKQALRSINDRGGINERFYLMNDKGSPAFEVDVYYKNPQYGGKLWYTFDVVPTLLVKQRGGTTELRFFSRQADDDEYWTIDTAGDEKEALKNIDNDGGCRKQSTRILKALRDYSPELRDIPSFIFKTLLLTEARKPGLDWRQAALADRVIGLLTSLQAALRSGQLYEVFNPRVNVMNRITSPRREQLQNRIATLLQNPETSERGLAKTIQRLTDEIPMPN